MLGQEVYMVTILTHDARQPYEGALINLCLPSRKNYLSEIFAYLLTGKTTKLFVFNVYLFLQ